MNSHRDMREFLDRTQQPCPLSEGMRVRVTGVMPDDPNPLPVGTEGTVHHGNGGQIWVKWDNGSTLALLVGRDPYEVLTPSPETVAEKYSQTIASGDQLARIEWEGRIPSVRFPRGKPSALLDKFQAVADERAASYTKATEDSQGMLWSALVQDDAAVACGMDADQRVTCKEHATWRTPEDRKSVV